MPPATTTPRRTVLFAVTSLTLAGAVLAGCRDATRPESARRQPPDAAIYGTLLPADGDAQFATGDVTAAPAPAPAPLAGLEIRSASVTLPADGKYRATCPAGKSVIAFGYESISSTSSSIRSNRPAINAPQMDWVFVAAPGGRWNFYWTCALAGAAVIGA